MTSDDEFDVRVLPTAEDIAYYRENGYFVSKKILGDDLIAQALEGSERLYRGEYDERFPWSGNRNVDPNFGVRFTERNRSRADGYASFHSFGLRALARQPVISAIAAALTGAAEIRYWKDQLIYKAPAGSPRENEGVTGFHQDKRYWPTCRSDRMITAWIPLHDCSTENGCLVVIKGSHRWRNNHALVTFGEKNQDFIKSKLINSEGEKLVEVPLALERGQVSFHDCYTIHGSYPNVSGAPRRALSVHLQDGENRYRDLSFLNKAKPVYQHSHDLICRRGENGFPDYSDPEIFPTLYRRATG
ncbi:phytanoyl-CoA dioxygenase family protein [Amycolatopsis sp. SID8362]|uniref:phytanoyl-CoA dioxygenase family protein n=1 Tax=Amycolatopsis sp. SID8362 TaxID=2690346 RepID=UPI001368D655|nr:phytanoyl-CoA dioxygenase family protein [Amycolatopsis sp. SID8362]NBH04617.1 phytanoyl-CoA dioxygenase [Amycolatopsis sp. SID8362]NED41316.1 phytanoyl-CoA dioxygenase family protein [Amycolatopsis sp. SID8362]